MAGDGTRSIYDGARSARTVSQGVCRNRYMSIGQSLAVSSTSHQALIRLDALLLAYLGFFFFRSQVSTVL